LGELFLPYRLQIQLLAAALALDARDYAAARAWLDAHRRWLDFAGVTLGRSEGQLLESRWSHARGNARHGRQHAEEALRLATTPRQPLALLAAHRQLGMLHTSAGDVASAEWHLAAALTLAEACRAPYERALTLLALAELQATSPDRARATLAEIRAICLPLGAHLALAQADRLSARLAQSPGPAAPGVGARSGPERSAAPARLSAREVEVLRLVAQGLTNAEIGERLSLTSRTVKAHVANIFGKLGVANRAAATRYAVEHDLT
jgi:DNA-binding CsgD family transcriptional regulator